MSVLENELSIEKKIAELLNNQNHLTPEKFDVTKELGKTTEHDAKYRFTIADKTSFQDVCQEIYKHISGKYKDEGKEKEKDQWIDLQHNAIIGVPESVKLFKDEIETYVREKNININYPEYYEDLIEAIFQETYGLGCVSVWWKHPDYHKIQACHIVGKNVYFIFPDKRKNKQPFSYESAEKVVDIAHVLKRKSNTAELNKQKPELEIDMVDGTRVTIFIPPRSKRPVIIFRNQTIKKTSLDDMANIYNTISDEFLQALKLIARLRANLLVVGKVRAGKSTLLKALYNERNPEDVCVVVEKDFHELSLGDHYPDNEIMEFIASGEEMKDFFPRLLRTDFTYVIIGEMRSVEADIYLQSCERGSDGSMATYHSLKLKNIPRQIAGLVVDESPSRKFDSEIQRVAEALDIIIACEEMPDMSKKVTRVAEVRLNADMTVSVHDLIRYDKRENIWRYTDDISDDLFERMSNIDYDDAMQLKRELARLKKLRPIVGDHVERSHKITVH